MIWDDFIVINQWCQIEEKVWIHFMGVDNLDEDMQDDKNNRLDIQGWGLVAAIYCDDFASCCNTMSHLTI